MPDPNTQHPTPNTQHPTPPAYDTLETDILILGSGGAGQLAALHARDAGRSARMILAVKGLFGKSG